MVLGFHTQFVAPIIAGDKIHTLREDPHERWHSGRVMNMATGVRTKNYREFLRKKCIDKQRIVVDYQLCKTEDWADEPTVFVDGRRLSADEFEKLAKNDGFADAYEFCKWFSTDFSGWILHWTLHRY